MADDNDGFVSAIDNPAAAAAIEALLADTDDTDPADAPRVPVPADGYVRLPGGFVGDTKIEEVEVFELDGEAEERLSKTRSSTDPMRFYNTLLESGVPEKIDGRDATEVLEEMLVGDREAIVLGIRKATFGNEVELGTAFCEECREEFEATLDLNDVPVRELKGDTTFEVALKKGGKARVRLPVGADQNAYLQNPALTDSERNSVLLSRCVITLPSNGEDMLVAAFHSLVLSLGIQDRRNILREIDKRQPGPRYDSLEIEHECGTKLAVPPLGMVSLFPGL